MAYLYQDTKLFNRKKSKKYKANQRKKKFILITFSNTTKLTLRRDAGLAEHMDQNQLHVAKYQVETFLCIHAKPIRDGCEKTLKVFLDDAVYL